MPSLKVGDRIGPYRVEQLYSEHRGGFAQVAVAARASSQDGKDLVAIKIAKIDQGDRSEGDTYDRALSNEVETLRWLKHPGIVRMYPIRIDERHHAYMARALDLPGNPWYFVMEYLSGGSVEDLIKNQGALDPTLAVEIAYQVCAALDYLHMNDFAHLDIKTTNILLRRPLDGSARPEAVLVDFGAAQKNVRRAEVEAGALVYLPPERVEVMMGKRAPETVIDKSAVDVYSLGVTLYRMLTGELPFHGHRSRVTSAILNETPTHPQRYSQKLDEYPELDALVMQMLEKRPDRRPVLKDIMTRLDQIIPPPRFSSGSTRDYTRSRGSKTWKYVALTLALLLVLETILLVAVWNKAFATSDTPTPAPPPAATATATLPPPPTLTPAAATTVAPTAPVLATATAAGPAVLTPTPPAVTPTPASAEPTATLAATRTATPTRRPTATPTLTVSSSARIPGVDG